MQPNENTARGDSRQAAADQAMAQNDDGPTIEPIPSDEITQLRLAVQEAQDRALRAQAELDNFRKRAKRELDDERRYADLPVLRSLLPVGDNIRRAIEAAEKSPDSSTSVLLDGIKMVAQNLEEVLKRHGGRKIEALNKPFDPAVHEAISQMPKADVPEHTVLMVVQDGYTLHDRVVRPAQVIVSTNPGGSA